MASVLLDLGLYGHDSLAASLGCPQPGPDLLSSGFLGSLRPVTSKKCPFHLAFLFQLRKPTTHFPSSEEAWTCWSEPRRWGLEHLTWEKSLRKLGLPVWKREGSGESYSHVCINIWWDGMKKSKPIFPVLYGDKLRGSGHKAKKLNSFWTHSSPTFFLLWVWSNTGTDQTFFSENDETQVAQSAPWTCSLDISGQPAVATPAGGWSGWLSEVCSNLSHPASRWKFPCTCTMNGNVPVPNTSTYPDLIQNYNMAMQLCHG